MTPEPYVGVSFFALRNDLIDWLANHRPSQQKVVYISGPMTNHENFNRPAFERARQFAEKCGCRAIVPGDGEEYTSDELKFMEATPVHRKQWLRKDVEDILTVDEVWVLDGWESSRGSTFEVLIALELGIPVFTENDGRVYRDVIRWEVI